MTQKTNADISLEFQQFIQHREFPCVAAKAALNESNLSCMVANHMACPADDADIIKFIYQFVDTYRKVPGGFSSAAVIFREPGEITAPGFDQLFWRRLQCLADLDALQYKYDDRVDADPASPNFSFSLGGEAFFIIGLHAASSRLARQFSYPAIVFNPHDQFENMRLLERYDKMKNIVRKRDMAYSGSINPMLDDFGNASEVYQYSGAQYDNSWKCPLNIHHVNTQNHPAT